MRTDPCVLASFEVRLIILSDQLLFFSRFYRKIVSVQAVYNMEPSCSGAGPAAATSFLNSVFAQVRNGGAAGNITTGGEEAQCLAEALVQQANVSAINRLLFCGFYQARVSATDTGLLVPVRPVPRLTTPHPNPMPRLPAAEHVASDAMRARRLSALCVQAACNTSDPHATNSYVYGFNFQNTTRSYFSLDLHYNNTNAVNSSNGPPYATRLNKVGCRTPCVGNGREVSSSACCF